ncbi:LPEAT1 [Symbiodinium microadriaticum]|nr:LPEAT1 [Symbiodinium microadriaticum]
MAMETSADIYHRARRVLVGAKMRQSKESWDELFHAADKDRSKTLDLKELTQATLPKQIFRICMTRFLVLLPFAICSAQFVCRDPGWSDDFCSPQGTNVSGCSGEGYGLLPRSPDWMQIRQRLIREIFGQEMLPRKSRPDSVTTKAVRHLFPDCLYAAWGSGNRSDCEKVINVTEIRWAMPARLKANYSMTLTSKVFLTLSTSGYAPNYDIWGAGQPADPQLPRKGKTLVLFHNGHGMSKGCPTYGDTDGSADWLNQMGFDVATVMMPFKDCNSDPHDPRSLHAWFQPFEDEGKPWVQYFLEPVINTINFAIDSLAYERIIMMGLSGGGWTTTLAAAVDPRIVLSIPIAGSLPCDFRHTSWDFEQFCSDRWAQIGNYTALYVLAALEKDRASVQMLHESDPCCFHACGRHSRIQDYNRFVNSAARGVFETVVTEGNLHQFNPREKVIAATLIGKIARKEEIKACDVQSPFNVLREKLRIPDTTLPDHEIQVVFCEIDIDKTGAISGPEFSRFVSRGPLNPEEEAKLFAVRVKRVHRNLRLGFRNYRTDDAAVRKLFDRIDRGGDGRISMHELMGFVREDLKLSRWDVFESEMKAFYKSMDDNGDGLDANELVKFIRHTRAANGKQHQRNQTGAYLGGPMAAVCQEAQRAEQRQEPLQAQRRFEEAAQLWSRICGREALAAEAWAEAGRLRLELGAPLDAVVACEHGLRLSARHWRLGFLSALALESIGLLSTAEERLQQAARLLTEVAAKEALSAVLEALRRVRARTAQLQAGEPQALMEEIQRMGSLLGDKEAGYWISSVGECSRSAEGQAELVQKGFLDSSQRDMKQPVAVARKASLVAMRYRVNKKLQRYLSGAGLLLGVAEQCVLPKALRHPGASELLGSAAEVLKSRRLAVVDGAFPADAIAQVQSELKMLRSEQVLQNDVNDVCNPLQEAKYLPYGADDAASAFRARCPITMQVTRQLAGLAAVLEELLGLDLAVPQSVMAACYPPHASYKMHLDSYFLQGCPDDVPRKVTVLLYCNHGWSPKVGGELRAWGPFDQGQGPAQTIEPLPGRMVVFLSEEIWHEVLESHGERFALVDKFSFVEDTSTSSAQLRRRPTYRTQLLSDRMPKSQSAGELRSGGGSPTFVSTPSFVNLGRTSLDVVSPYLDCSHKSSPLSPLFTQRAKDGNSKEAADNRLVHFTHATQHERPWFVGEGHGVEPLKPTEEEASLECSTSAASQEVQEERQVSRERSSKTRWADVDSDEDEDHHGFVGFNAKTSSPDKMPAQGESDEENEEDDQDDSENDEGSDEPAEEEWQEVKREKKPKAMPKPEATRPRRERRDRGRRGEDRKDAKKDENGQEREAQQSTRRRRDGDRTRRDRRRAGGGGEAPKLRQEEAKKPAESDWRRRDRGEKEVEAPKPVEKKPPAHPAREQKAPREQKESREPRKENGAGGEKKLVEKQGSRNSGEGDTGKFRPPNRRSQDSQPRQSRQTSGRSEDGGRNRGDRRRSGNGNRGQGSSAEGGFGTGLVCQPDGCCGLNFMTDLQSRLGMTRDLSRHHLYWHESFVAVTGMFDFTVPQAASSARTVPMKGQIAKTRREVADSSQYRREATAAKSGRPHMALVLRSHGHRSSVRRRPDHAVCQAEGGVTTSEENDEAAKNAVVEAEQGFVKSLSPLPLEQNTVHLVSRMGFAEFLPGAAVHIVAALVGLVPLSAGYSVAKLWSLGGWRLADSPSFKAGCFGFIYANGIFPSVFCDYGNNNFGPLPANEADQQAMLRSTPIIVANHVSYLDVMVLPLALQMPKFMSKAGVRNAPLFGTLGDDLEYIWVDRGSKDARGAALGAIHEHVAGWKDGDRPLLIFPEGTTSNGTSLLEFKQSAFVSGAPVRPVLLKHTGAWNPACTDYLMTDDGQRSLYSDGEWAMNFWAHLLHSCTIFICEPYYPSAEEKANPKLYASNVRAYMLEKQRELELVCRDRRSNPGGLVRDWRRHLRLQRLAAEALEPRSRLRMRLQKRGREGTQSPKAG